MKIKMLTEGCDYEFNRNVWKEGDIYELSDEKIFDKCYIIKTIGDDVYGVSKDRVNKDFIILEE